MMQPPPQKYKCPKCNYSKVVTPKSDALLPDEFLQICPKCRLEMEVVEMSLFDRIIYR